MNQMMLYSKVVTIRDAQIQEKRSVQAEKEEEERCLDAMMEIERLKALKMYEEREKERLHDQRRGAKVIIEQIKDRQAQRMRMEEQRDQERAFILKQIESLKAEEVEQQRQKKMAAERLMQEVNMANSAAMKIKEEKMLSEKLEEQKIIEYQENKEARERELEEEKARVAGEKEKETARLRAMHARLRIRQPRWTPCAPSALWRRPNAPRGRRSAWRESVRRRSTRSSRRLGSSSRLRRSDG
jgi:hypothetical protein